MSRKIITNEIIDKRLLDANRTIIRIGNYTKAREKIEWKCTVCNNYFAASPDNINRGKGCSYCANNKLLTNVDIDKKLIETYRPILRIGEYIGANIKIEWGCIKCEYIWHTTPSSILRGYGCPSCAGSRHLTNEIIDLELSKRNDKIYRKSNIINAKTKVKWQCNKGHEWHTTPGDIMNGTGCRICNINKRKLTNKIVDNRLLGLNIYRVGDFINTKTKIKWKCNYGHKWDATPSTILHRGSGCPVCQIKGTYNKGLTKKEQKGIAKLYFVKFTQKYTNISFVKIGITQKTINKRFDGYKKKYNIETLYFKQQTLLECINFEQEIIRKFNKFQYIPEGKFGGKTECFIDTPEVKESILKLLE